MDDFQSAIAEFKSYGELQAFADSQTKLILELQKKVKFLQEKNESLEVIINKSSISFNVTTIPITDQELIAREQIKVLKARSAIDELTYEEAKKLSEYTKILKEVESKEKSLPSVARKISTNDLLSELNEQA